MANSRLEKIGTIFTRVTGLLKSGAMKPEEKPLWYHVYEAFPPKLEPRYDRPAPNIPIKNIFYKEDVIRAKYHKLAKNDTINLADTIYKTNCHQFIEIYKNLQKEGAMSEEKIEEVSMEMLVEKIKLNRSKGSSSSMNLVENFTAATAKASLSDSSNKDPPVQINIKDLFKD